MLKYKRASLKNEALKLDKMFEAVYFLNERPEAEKDLNFGSLYFSYERGGALPKAGAWPRASKM